MVVKVISEGPIKPRKTVCQNCTFKLSYTGEDVKSMVESFMGDSDTVYYIDCPQCSYRSHVESW